MFSWKAHITSVVDHINLMDGRADRISQILMYECLRKRHETKSIATKPRHLFECPVQVSIGLSVHQFTRSRTFVDYLFSLGLSIPYKRVWNIENNIA
jgi:hypothetical protein